MSTDNSNRSSADRKDGGPAFPFKLVMESSQYGAPVITHYHEGMSVRDAFAISALQSQGILMWSMGPVLDTDAAATELARRAYLIADAMIAERKK